MCESKSNKKYVKFKTVAGIYPKERAGIKNNTVRLVDMNDERFKILKEMVDNKKLGGIIIENKETHMKFRRDIIDICFFRILYLDLCIITWRV